MSIRRRSHCRRSCPCKRWGAGSDTFVFLDDFGNDYIYDFSEAEGYKIELQVTDADSFDDLIIEMDDDDTVISFNDAATLADETVTLVDYDNIANPLMASDFDFIIV